MKKPGRDGKTAVVVGSVTDDLRPHGPQGEPLLRQGARPAPLQHAPPRPLQGPQVRARPRSQKELRLQGLSEELSGGCLRYHPGEKSGYFYCFYRFFRLRPCHRKYAAKNFLESFVAVFAIMGFF